MTWWEITITAICAYIIGFLVVGRFHRWAWMRWMMDDDFYGRPSEMSDDAAVVCAVFWPCMVLWWAAFIIAIGAVIYEIGAAIIDSGFCASLAKLLK